MLVVDFIRKWEEKKHFLGNEAPKGIDPFCYYIFGLSLSSLANIKTKFRNRLLPESSFSTSNHNLDSFSKKKIKNAYNIVLLKILMYCIIES